MGRRSGMHTALEAVAAGMAAAHTAVEAAAVVDAGGPAYRARRAVVVAAHTATETVAAVAKGRMGGMGRSGRGGGGEREAGRKSCWNIPATGHW